MRCKIDLCDCVYFKIYSDIRMGQQSELCTIVMDIFFVRRI